MRNVLVIYNRRLPTLVFATLLLVGCSGATTPGCSDAEVTELVKDIVHQEVVNFFFLSALQTRTGSYPASVLSQIPIETWKNNPPDPENVAVNFSFEVEDIQSIIREVEAEAQAASFQLIGIRVESEEPEYGRISCAANLRAEGGGEDSISYTAQYSEDGYLNVEVFGL